MNKGLKLGAAYLAAIAAAGCGGGGGGTSGGGGGGGGGGAVLKCAVARVVASDSDLVPGPIARGTIGDFVIENDKLRAIVQKGGRNWYDISEFGGNIIDGLPKAANGALI